MARYYYDKFNVVDQQVVKESYIGASSSTNGYPSYNFNGLFYSTGTYEYHYPGSLPIGKSIYESANGSNSIMRYYFTTANDVVSYRLTSVQEPTKGSLVQSNIAAEDGTYPVNGRHTDGYWYVKGAAVNTAPTQPGAFTKPTSTTLLIGNPEVISWGGSIDQENNLSKYILEMSVNGGVFTQIGAPATNSFTHTIPNALSVQFRVKAQDSNGLESNYRASNTYVVKTPNQAPTVSLTGPSDNATLYETDTLNIAGTAFDADPDQSVTAYYQINGEPKKVLATNLSQTQIALSKQLIFKGGKLYDGDTALTGTLADGVAHTLKVWAEDSEKASSAIVERTFYVVPNRAPLLSVDAVVPSGIVDADKFKISGTASDQDANSTVKVTRRINAGNAVEIYSGAGGAWDFDLALSQLVVGQNTIVIEVVDNYGAKASKTVTLNKKEVKTPILQSVARYKIEPPKGSAKGVLLFIQRDEELDVKVELSMTLSGEQEQYETLTPVNTASVQQGIVEDTFEHEGLEAKQNIILKITPSRADLSFNHKIHLISGAVD